jgi:hypothetical protein
MEKFQAVQDKLAMFTDLDMRISELLLLEAFMICPFTQEPFKVNINLQRKIDLTKIFQGQILFREADLKAHNLQHQSL